MRMSTALMSYQSDTAEFPESIYKEIVFQGERKHQAYTGTASLIGRIPFDVHRIIYTYILESDRQRISSVC